MQQNERLYMSIIIMMYCQPALCELVNDKMYINALMKVTVQGEQFTDIV